MKKRQKAVLRNLHNFFIGFAGLNDLEDFAFEMQL